MAKVSGKALVRQHGIEAKHALYRATGDWYHVLNAFPGALLDANGYLLFATQAEYDAFVDKGREQGVSQNLATNTLVVRDGIAGCPGYIRFGASLLFLDEEAEVGLLTEGARLRVTVNRYERDRAARAQCIRKWGLDCCVCGFSFEDVYGDLGNGFIHVHHLETVSSRGGEYTINPEDDLRPVCANCHAMLHRKDPPLTVEELRLRLQKV